MLYKKSAHTANLNKKNMCQQNRTHTTKQHNSWDQQKTHTIGYEITRVMDFHIANHLQKKKCAIGAVSCVVDTHRTSSCSDSKVYHVERDI
jgi:hypothetical protein